MSINPRRRSINMPESLSHRIEMAAAYLGLPSSEAFIRLAIDNELAEIASLDPSIRRILDRR